MSAALAIPDLDLSPREASALLDVPERRVRKEIEYGLFRTLSFPVAVYLRTFSGAVEMEPSVEWRRNLFGALSRALRHGVSVPEELELGAFFRLRLRSVAVDVHERLTSFFGWKHSRIMEDPSILGGEPVFKASRLSVRSIGMRVAKGEPVDTIFEDYPHLTAADLDFARLYAQAYPRVGRPRESAEAARR